MSIDVRPCFQFINERHAIWHRKQWSEHGVSLPPGVESLAPSPDLTTDPHLKAYRFCNVFRELDRVTIWIRKNIREPFADHPNLWIMLAIARTINWPDTLKWIIQSPGAWPLDDSWDPYNLFAALESYRLLGHKVYTGAYMIRAESNPKAYWFKWPKSRYIAEIVIGRLWEDRRDWEKLLAPHAMSPNTRHIPTIRTTWGKFQQPRYIGWGPFMAYQVVVDLRWTRYLQNASDIDSWASLGPGSRRGLNRLAGRPLNYPLRQDQGLMEMRFIHSVQDYFRAPWVSTIGLSDIQSVLCETDKYLRIKLGEGRPRSTYIPGRGF
jgi:hypothetical protein